MSVKRLLYLSSLGGHDFRFLEKLKTLPAQWQTLFATYKPELIPEVEALGIAVHNLNPEARPFDDWDRQGAYNFVQRLRLKQHFRTHRQHLRRLLQDFKPHLVHAGWLQTDSYIAACEKQTPLLVMEWGSDILVRPFDNQRNYRKTQWTLKQADYILCDCKAAVDTITKMLGNEKRPMLTIPWGLDLKQFHPESRMVGLQTPLRIAVVKNLVDVSRLDTLLQSLAILQQQGVAVELCGTGKLEATLKEQAQSLGVDTVVEFKGRINNTEIPQLLRRCDLYVSCNRSEGTSLAMMEAMACGAIPLVTDIPAYREWVEHGVNGFCFAVGNAKQLAELVTKVSKTDTNTLEKIRHHNYQLAKREFDWDKNFAKLTRVYEQLVA